MNTTELGLLKRASTEIKGLRQFNREQSIRLQMFDDMMLLLRTRTPEYGMQSTGIDIVREIDNAVAAAEQESQ